jgi:hypothetical protein
MSELDETWARIQQHLQIWNKMNSADLSERRQATLKTLAGMRKFQADLDNFLANAPRSDLRRDAALDLKELIANPPGS